MERGKQIEGLMKMKFMKRKEEQRRREAAVGIPPPLPAVTAAAPNEPPSASRAAGQTVKVRLMTEGDLHNVAASSFLGRRRFGVSSDGFPDLSAPPLPPQASAAGCSALASDDDDDDGQKAEGPQRRGASTSRPQAAATSRQEESGGGGIEALTMSRTEYVKQVRGAQGRFFVEDSVRAPPMPRRLERAVTGQQAKRTREDGASADLGTTGSDAMRPPPRRNYPSPS